MVAEHGSTLTAARHLEVTQSTISRHLSELERQLSVQLFDRRKTGLVLTDKGHELLSFAKKMDNVADSMQAQASHFSSSVSGTVRVSASEVLAVDVLPFCLDEILNENPDLQVEIVASNEESNLLSREADIALRMFQPQQQDLISRHLVDIPVSFYAHQKYIEKYGRAGSMDDFLDHRFIGFDINPLFIDGAKQIGIRLKREDFYIRTDSIIVQNQCAAAGLGMVLMQTRLADQMPGLTKIALNIEIPSLPLFIVAQKELRASRKLRVVYDGLAEALLKFYKAQ
jgi:DNA-binding transcriptional LysR family regulator